MGLPLSDTSTRTGIVQLIEDRTNTVSATTSSYSLSTKVRDINQAYAKFMSIAVVASGRWQVDDTNQSDYPITSVDLISGQQDYAFTIDGSTPTNQVLDLHRVEMLDSAGNWGLLRPLDIKDVPVALDAYQPTGGTPSFYDKTSNAIFLYPAPNYTAVGGLKFYFSRTPVYFLTSDTTKQAGIPDIFHEYLAVRPSYFYCLSKGLSEKAKAYKIELMEMEDAIKRYYGSRQRDEDPAMTVNNSRWIDRRGVGLQGNGNGRGMVDWR